MGAPLRCNILCQLSCLQCGRSFGRTGSAPRGTCVRCLEWALRGCGADSLACSFQSLSAAGALVACWPGCLLEQSPPSPSTCRSPLLHLSPRVLSWASGLVGRVLRVVCWCDCSWAFPCVWSSFGLFVVPIPLLFWLAQVHLMLLAHALGVGSFGGRQLVDTALRCLQFSPLHAVFARTVLRCCPCSIMSLHPCFDLNGCACPSALPLLDVA